MTPAEERYERQGLYVLVGFFSVIVALFVCIAVETNHHKQNTKPFHAFTDQWSKDVKDKGRVCATLANNVVKKDKDKVVVFNNCLKRFGATI